MIVIYPSIGVLPKPVKPFSAITVYKNDKTNKITIVTHLLLARLVDYEGNVIEGAEFGLALDGSASMADLYGFNTGSLSPVANSNIVAQVARPMLEFLNSYADDGTVNLAFWAVGPDGVEIEDKGDLSISMIDSLSDDDLSPKITMGRSAHLLPIMKHFAEMKFRNSKWFLGVIVTDGRIDDLEEVEKYTEQIAVEIDSNKRNPFKLVLIGLGKHGDVGQLEELIDFETSVGIEVWSAMLATEMQYIHEIFDGSWSTNLIFSPSCKITDNNGQILKSYTNGIPEKMEFVLNKNSTGFKLEIPGEKPIEQDLTEALVLLRDR